MELSEIRRINLRKMMESEGALKLAGRLGYRQSSFLSQISSLVKIRFNRSINPTSFHSAAYRWR